MCFVLGVVGRALSNLVCPYLSMLWSMFMFYRWPCGSPDVHFTIIYACRSTFCVSLLLPLGCCRLCSLMAGVSICVFFAPWESCGLVRSGPTGRILAPRFSRSTVPGCVWGCVFLCGSTGPAPMRLSVVVPVPFCKWFCVFRPVFKYFRALGVV